MTYFERIRNGQGDLKGLLLGSGMYQDLYIELQGYTGPHSLMFTI